MWSFDSILEAATYTRSLPFVEEVHVMPIRTAKEAAINIHILFTNERSKKLEFRVATPGKRTVPDFREMRVVRVGNGFGDFHETAWLPNQKGFHAVTWKLVNVTICKGSRKIFKEASTDIFTETMMKFRLGWHQEDAFEDGIEHE